MFSNDVYGILPFDTVLVGGVFSFSIYCDSSYAVASFGVRIVIGPSLVITGAQVDSQRWAHVTISRSSFEWFVSATLTDPEAAPQGFVKKAKLVSFDVKVQDTAVVNTSATVTAEVSNDCFPICIHCTFKPFIWRMKSYRLQDTCRLRFVVYLKFNKLKC